MDNDPQQVWDDYYDRIKRRRLKAAELLWDEVVDAGASEDTVFALDFVHFGNDHEGVDNLAQQLSEIYAMEVSAANLQNYRSVKGTTRPVGISLIRDQLAAWVEFMVDVARSYGWVFSEWTLEAPALGRTFRSAHLDHD